jgi:hypothetical protein
MSQETTRFRRFLESNPKWIGILFAALTLLSQAGMAAAGGGATTGGP